MLNRLSKPTKPAAAGRSHLAGEHFLNHRRRLAQHADPAVLGRLSKPTKPAAAGAVTWPANISWIIATPGRARPMPAVTLRSRNGHKSQNCGVLIATSTVTSRGSRRVLPARSGNRQVASPAEAGAPQRAKHHEAK